MEANSTETEIKGTAATSEMAWYRKPIWILLLFFFLIGIFLMWSYLSWQNYEKLENPSNSTTTAQTSPFLDANATHTASVSSTASPSGAPISESYAVISVTDGDTFKVSMNGATETVRIVGINTPETVDPRKSVECFGTEASNKLKAFLTGKKVQLEADKTQSDRDKYGRLLRFVALDGVDVGLQMIRQGYAYESLYSAKPHKNRDAYLEAQRRAQTEKVGLWADTACASSSVQSAPATPKTVAIPTTTPTFNTGGKSCGGLDLDCSDFSSKAEVRAFFSSCGWSAENDPMRLDSVGVGDGIPCESLP